jgi:hypothetical protein
MTVTVRSNRSPRVQQWSASTLAGRFGLGLGRQVSPMTTAARRRASFGAAQGDYDTFDNRAAKEISTDR